MWYWTSTLFNETLGQQSCVLVTPHQQKCMLQLNPTNRNAGYCCTGSEGKLHPASVHVCSTYSRPAAQASLLQSQQTYLLLRMFDYVTLDQHIYLKPSSYVYNSFTRLAGMLQYPCFKLCFEPTGMFVAVATGHLARRLQLNSTSMHVCYGCIYPQICLNQLQLTFKHIYSCVAEPAGIYVTHLPQTRSYAPMLVPN